MTLNLFRSWPALGSDYMGPKFLAPTPHPKRYKTCIGFGSMTLAFLCKKQCCGAGAARSRPFWEEPEPPQRWAAPAPTSSIVINVIFLTYC